MVTYQIKIPESKKEAFLQILLSLQSVGVVKSFKSFENLAIPGESLSTEQLLALLEESTQQGNVGLSFTTEESKSFLSAWKLRRRA